MEDITYCVSQKSGLGWILVRDLGHQMFKVERRPAAAALGASTVWLGENSSSGQGRQEEARRDEDDELDVGLVVRVPLHVDACRRLVQL